MNERIAALREKLLLGVAPAMATPLDHDGYSVNLEEVPELVDFLLARGVQGLFVGGTTGEGILLDASERMQLHEKAVTAVNGRVPVLVHVGANRTDTAVALARQAEGIGADAIAAVTPTFYGMSDGALADYYHAIAAAAPHLPLFLYDIPHMAVNGISPALLQRLGAELPNLAGVKTSQGNVQTLRELIDAAPPHLMILIGNERIALGALALGAHGLISGLSTAVPEPFVALMAAYKAGNLEEARRQQRLINQLLDLLPAGARLGGIKQILQERGLNVGKVVPPRPMPTAPVWAKMTAVWSP